MLWKRLGVRSVEPRGDIFMGGTRTRGCAQLFTALIVAATAGADPGEIEKEASTPLYEIVVTATRTPRPADLMPASVTVIGGEEIAAQHRESLNDVLRYVNGLYLQQQGARGGRADIHLRGLDPNHVVVMVDGIRLNDITNTRGGSFDPSTLAPLDIERIEIVRGPRSAMYGSDPLAGVINIITRRTAADEEISATLRGGGGRYATGHVRGSANAGLGFAGLSLAGSFDHNGAPHSSGGYEGGNLKATLDSELPVGDAGEIGARTHVRFNDSKSEAFPEASGGYELAVRRELEKRDVTEVSGGLQLDGAWDDWITAAFQVDHAHRWEDLRSPGVEESFPGAGNELPATLAASEMGRTHLGFVLSPILIEPLAVNLGFDFLWETGDRRSILDFGGPVRSSYRLDRRTGGVFLEGFYELAEGVSLSASFRGDFPEGQDSEFSPAVGASARIPRTPLTIFGSWSRGFKLPSFFALGDPLIGNPLLESEHSQGWEVGIRGSFFDGRLLPSFTYFDIDVENLIDFDFSTFSLVNRGEVVSKGVELAVEAPVWERVRFGGSFSYNPTNIRNTSTDLRNRPKYQGELHLDSTPIDGLQVGLRVLFIGSREDASNPTGFGQVTLNGYQRVDFSGSYEVYSGVKIWLAIENLVDQEYEEAVGFPAPGIYPRAGAEFRF